LIDEKLQSIYDLISSNPEITSQYVTKAILPIHDMLESMDENKGMIDFGSLSDKRIDISSFPSHESVAFNMGKDSVDQKGKFIGTDQGPASMGEVVHLYNFENIRNRTETPLLMQAVLNGAEQAAYMDGIIFLNYE
jgi:hypothetical protein